MACCKKLCSVLDRGLELRGGKDALGFLFLYELITGTLKFGIRPEDSTYLLATYLVALLPQDARGGGFNASPGSLSRKLRAILDVACAAPFLVPGMPRFDDTRKFKIATIVAGQDVAKRLLRNVQHYFSSRRADLARLPRHHAPQLPATIPVTALDAAIVRGDRAWRAVEYQADSSMMRRAVHKTLDVDPSRLALETGTSLYVAAVLCARFGDVDILACANRPLAAIAPLDAELVLHAPAALGSTSGKLPFDLEAQIETQGVLAKRTLARFEADVIEYAAAGTTRRAPMLCGLRTTEEIASATESPRLHLKRATQLAHRLEDLRKVDTHFVREAATACVLSAGECIGDAASTATWAVKIRSGLEARPWFGLLIEQLLSTCGDGELNEINPGLGPRGVAIVRELTIRMLLASSRATQLGRCCATAKALCVALATKVPVHAEISLRSRTLAEQLDARRSYCVSGTSDDGALFWFDPRLLVFEFIHGLLLRLDQCRLVNSFASSALEGASHCEQMIMGGGKTTVVSPLLALVLGDGERLVCQVVPHALLEFSRNTMRERFASITRKTIYTMRFDRYLSLSSSFCCKLERATKQRAIVCASPTSVKSFVLKIVELLDELDHVHNLKNCCSRSNSFLSLWRRRDVDGTEINEAALRGQIEVGVRTLRLFNGSHCLLDEVDLILHPLKSELNWPLGVKSPLDFTASHGSVGKRWLAPYHLLDAIFFCTGQNISVDDFEESCDARKCLADIRAALDEGVVAKVVQTTPHIILLSRLFYEAKVVQPLASWALLYLRAAGLRGINDADALDYLSQGASCHTKVRKTVQIAVDDESSKLLNLVSDWLRSLLPFTLGKIDRVSFGLLSMDDLRRLEHARTPPSRRLCAVPFVGKDVPSRASEFSQPDVVIGLTILAYRYEGLRATDLVIVLRSLREAMGSETGPYEKRPACQTFARWVRLAGGRVRGVVTSSEADSRVAVDADQMHSDDLFNLLFERDDVGDSHIGLNEIWPLHIVDTRDSEQMRVLYHLLRKVPQMILHYLHTHVFPITCAHQGLKLSASGQELGGDLVFGTRLGFSGTPSELMPLELGSCHYERKSDGKMVSVLSDSTVCSSAPLPNIWDADSVLRRCAEGDLVALIDTGALVTGYSNKEVAKTLLFGRGKLAKFPALPRERFDGVVYLDESDRKMILLRDGSRTLPLEQSSIPSNRRFTFYDQIHTTGMDIKQPLDARAAITLSKDMTVRIPCFVTNPPPSYCTILLIHSSVVSGLCPRGIPHARYLKRADASHSCDARGRALSRRYDDNIADRHAQATRRA